MGLGVMRAGFGEKWSGYVVLSRGWVMGGLELKISVRELGWVMGGVGLERGRVGWWAQRVWTQLGECESVEVWVCVGSMERWMGRRWLGVERGEVVGWVAERGAIGL